MILNKDRILWAIKAYGRWTIDISERVEVSTINQLNALMGDGYKVYINNYYFNANKRYVVLGVKEDTKRFSMCIYTGEMDGTTPIPRIVLNADDMMSLLADYIEYVSDHNLGDHKTEVIYNAPDEDKELN